MRTCPPSMDSVCLPRPATDSKGNPYTGEAGFGRRLQEFVRVD